MAKKKPTKNRAKKAKKKIISDKSGSSSTEGPQDTSQATYPTAQASAIPRLPANSRPSKNYHALFSNIEHVKPDTTEEEEGKKSKELIIRTLQVPLTAVLRGTVPMSMY